MYLKSLELHGFKSFAEKTMFEFHPGVTGIVGPNGCGKSNVVDAIRWVLGETSAKALRGGEMADVIFSGTEKRKPLGMAEVTLTLSNCEEALGVEYSEVAITRRVFRDGRSEYRINGTLCRLRDISELFMDTGIGRTAYSIMEQGKIDMLLSSKPEDRRMVFEEAAGITKFKKQKRETLRKLEYTEANLLRHTDIIAEVTRQMNSMRRQAAKARRFETLLGDVRVLETHLAFKHYTEWNASKEELDNSIASLRRQAEAIERDLGNCELDLERDRAALAGLESRLSETRHQISENENRIQADENRIVYNKERAKELEELIAANLGDIEQTKQKRDAQESERQHADEALATLRTRVASQQQEVAQREEEAREIRNQRAEATRQIASLRQQANDAESRLATIKARLENNKAQRQTGRQREEQLSEELHKLESQLESQKKDSEAIRKRISELGVAEQASNKELGQTDRAHRNAMAEFHTAREHASAIHRQLTEKQSRLEVLVNLTRSGEGLEEGTQALLSGLDDPEFFKSGLRGVLAESMEVAPDDVLAVEAAIGARLQTVMVADHQLAARMLEVLHDKSLGRASILSTDLLPPADGGQMLTVPEGSIAWALDRVKISPELQPIAERLLHKVLLVDDMETALRLRKDMPDVTFATSGGTLLTADGIMEGGRGEKSGTSILERQNEIRALEVETAEIETQFATANANVESLQERIRELTSTLESLRDDAQNLKVERSTLEGQVALMEREAGQLRSRHENLEWELEELRGRSRHAEEEAETLTTAEEETSAGWEQARKAVQEHEKSLETLAAKENEAVETLNQVRTRLAVELRSQQALEEKLQPMDARLHELSELAKRRHEENEAHRQRVEAAARENETLIANIDKTRHQLEELNASLSEANQDRQQAAEALRAAETKLQALRRQHSNTNEQRGREEVQATQIELRMENILNNCRERHNIDLTAFEQDIHALSLAIEQQKKKRRHRSDNADVDSTSSDDPEASTDSEQEEPGQIAATHAVDGEGPDWDFVEEIVGDLRQRLEAMGPVNLDAIQEFQELEERCTFLQAQHDDLVNSKEELRNIIEHINKETKQLFIATFESVRDNFKDMFKTLFGERAQANLLLTDENDPLECGIEIIAKPPGKKLQSISLLSGGERSLTAVALLFSIYMVKPSPFCVLDELDAPLDEANIGRFLKVLDRFIDRSQFIIVTHSKRTMARADVMYGVTMEEFGISKLIGMRLTKASEANGQEAEVMPKEVQAEFAEKSGDN